ncbi:hypothetical protein CYY_004668 [Polysphondylium violaceum]|uniref:NB-ARC domain-containing protein n=1 Tax=Polysphondylium violaceum TaxID=133409 RepID=A0A8J4PUT1_9MYCE|nr:hypothetical protein CYY_004668 [Polysphondylium violaceum]
MQQHCVCLLHSTVKEAQTTVSLFVKNSDIKFTQVQRDKQSDLSFREGTLKINDDRSLIKVVISFTSNQGGGYTMLSTMSLLNKFNPSLAILCGTCSGYKGQTKKGDVIVVEKSLNYETCTRTNKGDQYRIDDLFGPKDSFISWLKFLLSNEEIENEWRSYPSLDYSSTFQKEWLLRVFYEYQQKDKDSSDWLKENKFDTKQLVAKNDKPLIHVFGNLDSFRNILKELMSEKKIMANKVSDDVVELIENSLTLFGDFPIDLYKETKPSLHYGHFGCGSALEQQYYTDSNNRKTSLAFKKCRSISDNIIGIDRESHAFYQATASKPDIDAISIKSVLDHSDGGDDFDKINYNDFCNQVSSSLALQIIKSYTFSPKKEIFISNTIPILPKNTIDRFNNNKKSYIENIFDIFGSKVDTTASSAFKNNIISLSGMGGVGKSTLAKQFAFYCSEKKVYNYIFWIYGDSKESLVKSYTDILKNYLNKTLDNENDDQIIKKFNAEIKKLQGSVLLIYDNVETFKLQDKVIGDKINIIYTTRSRDVDDQSEILTLGLLSKEECFDLFRKWLPEITLDQVDILSTILNCLPLAISHSVAYIIQEKITIDQYFQEFQGLNEIEVYKEEDYQNSNSYERIVGKTISMAIGRIGENNNLESRAKTLMHFISFLNPDQIESTVLELLLQGKDDRVHGVIDLLNTYSLITIDQKRGGQSYNISVHRVIQRSILVSDKVKNIDILNYIHTRIHSFIYSNQNNIDLSTFYQFNNISQHLSNIQKILHKNYKENKNMNLGNQILSFQIIMHRDYLSSRLKNEYQALILEHQVIKLDNGAQIDKKTFFKQFIQKTKKFDLQWGFGINLTIAYEIFSQFLVKKKNIQDADCMEAILQFIIYSYLMWGPLSFHSSRIEKYSNLSTYSISKINQLLNSIIVYRDKSHNISIYNWYAQEWGDVEEYENSRSSKESIGFSFPIFELILDGLKGKSNIEFSDTIDSLIKLNQVYPLTKEMVENIGMVLIKNPSQSLALINSASTIFGIRSILQKDSSDFMLKLSFLVEKDQLSKQLLAKIIDLSKSLIGDNQINFENVIQIIIEISNLFLKNHFTNIQVEYIINSMKKYFDKMDFSSYDAHFHIVFELNPYLQISSKSNLSHDQVTVLVDDILSLTKDLDPKKLWYIFILARLVYSFPAIIENGKFKIILSILKSFDHWDIEDASILIQVLSFCNFDALQLSTLNKCLCTFPKDINNIKSFDYLGYLGYVVKAIYSNAHPDIEKIISLEINEMDIHEKIMFIIYRAHLFNLEEASTLDSRFIKIMTDNNGYAFDKANDILNILKSLDETYNVTKFIMDTIDKQSIGYDEIKSILVKTRGLGNAKFFCSSLVTISIIELLLNNRNNTNLDLVFKFITNLFEKNQIFQDFSIYSLINKLFSKLDQLKLEKHHSELVFKYFDQLKGEERFLIEDFSAIIEISNFIFKYQSFQIRILDILQNIVDMCKFYPQVLFYFIPFIVAVSTLYDKFQINDDQMRDVINQVILLLKIFKSHLIDYSIIPEIFLTLGQLRIKQNKDIIHFIIDKALQLYEYNFITVNKVPEILLLLSTLLLQHKQFNQVSQIIDWTMHFDPKYFNSLIMINNISSTLLKYNLKNNEMNSIIFYFSNSCSIYTLDHVSTFYLQNPIFFKQTIINMMSFDPQFYKRIITLLYIGTYNSEQANYIVAKYKLIKGKLFIDIDKLFKPTKTTCIKNCVEKSKSNSDSDFDDDESDGKESNSDYSETQDTSDDFDGGNATAHLQELYDFFGEKRIDKHTFAVLLNSQYGVDENENEKNNVTFGKLLKFKQYLKDPEPDQCDHIDLIYKSLLNAQQNQLDPICAIIDCLYQLKKEFFCCTLHISNNILRILYYDYIIGDDFLNSILTILNGRVEEHDNDHWVKDVIINSFNPKTKFNCNININK